MHNNLGVSLDVEFEILVAKCQGETYADCPQLRNKISSDVNATREAQQPFPCGISEEAPILGSTWVTLAGTISIHC
ncbi:hypothetical protein Scep_001301 [Stephania cephalantha]|uniref:Uncharacterized protein n=1 Tax=Stephania cephalantha TaxID=152367 RepID=A0AAP0LAH1_9MAGN